MNTQHFAKPENALKRAEEYINVGDKPTALQTLHSVLGSKRYLAKDKSSQKTFERIMIKYLDLCIELRRGKMAKDGLHQYKYVMKTGKGIPVQQNAPSLEVVIRHFLAGAEKAVKEAQSKSDELVGEIEDLDEAPSAETLMLTAVSGEGAKGRTDRQVVTPWLKFLWETYRTVLEILRNNPKLEHLYAYTAQQAFSFCQFYNRKTEFRRLCEILRNHLQGLNKPNTNQVPGVTLTNPETAQLLLEIRFAQLNVATQMELWQESFRSVEDVHNLMLQSKKSTSPEMMCLYYERLTQIFWQAKNYLFHSFSCVKYFNLLRKLKPEMTTAQVGALASQVLLSALSIPVSEDEDESDFEFDFDVQKEKNYRLASLLGFSIPVPRNVLIADLMEKNISLLAYSELQGLHETLESKLSPLTFGKSVSQYLAFIRSRSELQVYAQPIAVNAFRRLMQQIAPIYKTIKIARLCSLAPFIDSSEVERLIVESVNSGLFEARIDHQIGVIRFSTERIDSDQMKYRLSSLSSRFETAIATFDPTVKQQQQAQKQKVFARVLAGLEEEHSSILVRKAFIEKRKEAEEERNRRKIKEKEEKARLEAEEQKRAAEIEAEEKKKMQEQLQEKLRKAKQEQTKKEVPTESDFQEQVKKQVQKLREEKEDMEKKLKKLSKRLDHLERARREEERPLLEDLFQTKIQADKKYHEDQIRRHLDEHKAMHQRKLAEKKRVMNVQPHRSEFESIVMERRMNDFKELKKSFDESRSRIQSRLDELNRQQESLMEKREKIENRKRILEEEEQRKREEEEAKKRAEAEEKARLEREKLEKLEEQRRKQQEREREILAKQQQQQDTSKDKWRGQGAARPAAGRPAEEKKWGRPTAEEPRRAADEAPGKWRRQREEEPPRQEEAREEPKKPADSGRWSRPVREEEEPRNQPEKSWRGEEPKRTEQPSEGKWRRNEESSDRWGGRSKEPQQPSSRGEEGNWRNDNNRGNQQGGEGEWKTIPNRGGNRDPRGESSDWRSQRSGGSGGQDQRSGGSGQDQRSGGQSGGGQSQDRWKRGGGDSNSNTRSNNDWRQRN